MSINIKMFTNKEVVEFYDSIKDGKACYKGDSYTVGDINDPLFRIMTVKFLQERLAGVDRTSAECAELNRLLKTVAVDKFESHGLTHFIVMSTYKLSEKEVKVEMLKILKKRHFSLFYKPIVDFFGASGDTEMDTLADSLSLEKLMTAMDDLSPDGYHFGLLENVRPSVYVGYTSNTYKTEESPVEYIHW